MPIVIWLWLSVNCALSCLLYKCTAEPFPPSFSLSLSLSLSYLANDIEEDDEDEKYEIFSWALGKKTWASTYPLFLSHRDRLWCRMGFRAIVSKKTCDEVSKERERAMVYILYTLGERERECI